MIQEHLERGEVREDLRGESDKSQPFDSIPDFSEARNDIWSIGNNIHVDLGELTSLLAKFTWDVLNLNAKQRRYC